MEFLLDEYMTYYMFKADNESDAKSSYSSSLAASVGASFFKIAMVPIPVVPRSTLRSKALSEDPSQNDKANLSWVNDGAETIHNSSPLLSKQADSVITGTTLKTPEFEFVSGFDGSRNSGGQTDNY